MFYQKCMGAFGEKNLVDFMMDPYGKGVGEHFSTPPARPVGDVGAAKMR